jgi:hypothetical protein
VLLIVLSAPILLDDISYSAHFIIKALASSMIMGGLPWGSAGG